MSSSASTSKAKDASKPENPGCAPFSSSNSSNRSQSKVINLLHNSVKNQKPIPLLANRNRSKSSSLSDKRAAQLTSVEINSYSRTTPGKTSAMNYNVNSNFSRMPFVPAMKNFQNPRRRSFSSTNFEENEPAPIKSSMVITNSRLAPEINNDQTLSSITFNDEICFALPPKLNLQDLQGCSSYDVSYLLEVTRDMNLQLKKRKKRSKKPRDQFAPRQTNTSNLKPSVRTEPNRSSASRNVKNNIPQVNSTFSESPQTDAQSSQSTSNALKLPKPSRQISPSDLLKIRASGVPDNPDIIGIVKKLRLDTDKHPPCELINEEKLKLRIQKPSSIPPVSPLIKQLMQRSWLDLEENGEERTSRAIYENLKHIVQNFDDNDQDGKSGTDEKSKKKKPKKKANENADVKNKTQNSEMEDPANLVFEEYYDRERVDKGLQDGSFFKDNIRINSKNYKEAYIFSSDDGRDIFIDGIRDRNRALEGDEVVVEMHPEEKWKVHNDESVQKCGKVVFILRENHPRTAVGYLKMMFKKNKIDKFLLCPRDSRIPRIKIAPNLCPPRIKNDFKRFEDFLFEGKILKWETVSFAEGILLRELGKHNDIETETKCILLENHLNVEPFEDNGCLASIEETIPESEIRNRVDIRNQCVITIDPVGAKDLDDALSCVELSNGNFEVGIHIADVSYYLQPDTPLDENAREKATSVYLTQKVFHMLPHKLCDLCSLLPSTDKLAFSLFVELDQNAEVVSHRFSRTVIRSCSQFTYQHAQTIMEKETSELNADDFPPIENGFTLNDVVKAILNLQSLARKIRKRRFDGGALRIDQPKILFRLDQSSFPTSYSLFVPNESNWLIEEFMLLANILAANRLREHYPDLALLRNHSPPNERSLSNVVENLEKIGIYIDTTNAGSIYQSMMRYEGFDEIGMARMAVIINLLVKPMVKACYTCSTSDCEGVNDFWHYALNVPFYTHFTSPIRRYADIVVHRLLASSLGYCELPKWTPEDIQSIAENCNKKKNSAKKASEVCSELFLKLYMEKHGPIKVRAVVIDVKERFFDLIDLSTRSNHRVYTERIKIANVKFENDDGVASLKLTWKGEGETEPIEQLIQIFTIVDAQLAYNKSVNKVTASLLRPSS